MNLNVKIIDERIKDLMPKYETVGSAGLDLRACISEPLRIRAGETVLIGTGLAININNPAYAGMILPRSSLGHKRGIVLGNLVGVIDSDYQGELKLSVWNRSQIEAVVIEPFERIAQLVIVPIIQVDLNIVEEFKKDTERGEGGFGSTGLK